MNTIPTFNADDAWDSEPSPIVASARVAWQDRVIRGITDQLESDIRTITDSNEDQLATIYQPIVQAVDYRLGATARDIAKLQSRMEQTASIDVRRQKAEIGSVFPQSQNAPTGEADNSTTIQNEPLTYGVNDSGAYVDIDNKSTVIAQPVPVNEPMLPTADDKPGAPLQPIQPLIPDENIPDIEPPKLQLQQPIEEPPEPQPQQPIDQPQPIQQAPAPQQQLFAADPANIQIVGAALLGPPEKCPDGSEWVSSGGAANSIPPYAILDGRWYRLSNGNYEQWSWGGPNNNTPTVWRKECPPLNAGDKPPEGDVCELSPLPTKQSCNAPNLIPMVDISQLINWNDPDVCAAMEQMAKTGHATNELEKILSFLQDTKTGKNGFYDPASAQEIRDEMAGKGHFPPSVPNYIQPFLETASPTTQSTVNQFVESAAVLLQQYVQPHPSAVGCEVGQGFMGTLDRMIKGFLNTLTSQSIAPIVRANDYIRDYRCPNAIPEQPGLDLLRTVGSIDLATWTCLTRALGHTPHWHDMIVKAGFTKPDVLQTIMAWRRKEIKTEEELNARLKKLGVVGDEHRKEFIKLTEALPGISDIIRFLVRDVADDEGPDSIVQKFDLDADFDKKWQGKLIEFAEAQGVTTDVAKYAWRAHWDVPARTHVNEFFQRLRLDRQGNPRDPSGIVVSKEDVETLYKQNDMAPYWVQKYLATQYHVMGRIDIRRAYATGAFGEPLGEDGWFVPDEGEPVPRGKAEEELIERNQDLGYNPRDAAVLAYYTSVEWGRSKNNKTKTAAIGLICESYQIGAIDEQEADRQLRELGETRESAERRLATCDGKMKLKTLRAYISAVKKLYMFGDIDNPDVIRLLTGRGMIHNKVMDILNTWVLERQARAKTETHSMLCTWYSQGIINGDEFYARLIRIGYPDDVATRIIRSCIAGNLQRSAKEANQRAQMQRRERMRELERQKREEERMNREIEKSRKTALSLRSESNLKQWWNEGVIDESYIRTTFRIRGYDANDVNKWIAANRPVPA